jgi:tetratricopeptide (TPR) repeat protein
MRHNFFDSWFASAHAGLDAASAAEDQRGMAEMHDNLGMAHVAAHQLDDAISHHTAALEIRRQLGDRLSEAVSLNAIGLALLRSRKLADAATYFSESAGLFGQIGDASWQAFAEANLAGALAELGELPRATELIHRSMAQFSAERSADGTGNALWLLSRINRRQGNIEDALRHAQAAVDLAVEHENRMWEGLWLIDLGAAQVAAGRATDALVSYQRAASIQRRLGDRVREALALNGTGSAYRQLARRDEAISFYRGAVLILNDVQAPWNLAIALNDLAFVLSEEGRPAEAATKWRQALSLLEDFTDPAATQLRLAIAQSLTEPPPE